MKSSALRSVLAIGGVLLGLEAASADPMADCVQWRDPALRIEACGRIIAGAYTVPEQAKAYRHRGEARLNAGAFDDAVADFTEAIRRDPADAVSFAGRGQARLGKSDRDAAIADFDQAIRLAPKSAAYHNARGHARLVTGKAEAAAEDFSTAIMLDPRSASALNNRGLARSKLGDTNAAIADYSQAIALNPSYALAYNNRGYAHEAQGRKTEAAADFSRALDLDPALVGARDGLKRVGGATASAIDTDRMIADGKRLSEKNCAWCHATGPDGKSKNAKAPPFRDINRRHGLLALREPLARGIASPHDEMPNFKLPDADVDRIIAYINSLARGTP